MKTADQVAEAISEALTSPNVSDANGECANVVDTLNRISLAASQIARAITPDHAAPGHDATGGTIMSLTEAMMGVTSGLVCIAESISELASAVRDRDE